MDKQGILLFRTAPDGPISVDQCCIGDDDCSVAMLFLVSIRVVGLSDSVVVVVVVRYFVLFLHFLLELKVMWIAMGVVTTLIIFEYSSFVFEVTKGFDMYVW